MSLEPPCPCLSTVVFVGDVEVAAVVVNADAVLTREKEKRAKGTKERLAECGGGGQSGKSAKVRQNSGGTVTVASGCHCISALSGTGPCM